MTNPTSPPPLFRRDVACNVSLPVHPTAFHAARPAFPIGRKVVQGDNGPGWHLRCLFDRYSCPNAEQVEEARMAADAHRSCRALRREGYSETIPAALS